MSKLLLMMFICLVFKSGIILVEGNPHPDPDSVIVPVNISTHIGDMITSKDDCQPDVVIHADGSCKCGTTETCQARNKCVGGDKCTVPDFQITPGTVLNKLDVMVSKNGKYKLEMMEDGNLVLFKIKDNSVLWSTGASNTCHGNTFTFRTDGNLVVSDDQNVACWESHTDGSKADALILRNDGQLALMDGNQVHWISETEEPIYTATGSEISTDNWFKRTTDNWSEETTDNWFEETTDNWFEETTKNWSEETTDNWSEETTDNWSKETTDNLFDETTYKSSEETTDKLSEETTDKWSEETTDNSFEEAAGNWSENATKNQTEKNIDIEFKEPEYDESISIEYEEPLDNEFDEIIHK